MVANISRILFSLRWNVSNFPKMYISLKSNCLSEGVCSSFSLVLWKHRWYSWKTHYDTEPNLLFVLQADSADRGKNERL